MIELELFPQGNNKIRQISYNIEGDVLKVTINNVEEVFDFSDLPDGYLDSVEIENLTDNPILSVRKSDGVINIRAIRFYNETEREEFEDGYIEMEESGGDR